MEGRVIKFTEHINNVDEFIDTVLQRENNEIYLKKKIKINSCKKGDFIFFQKNGFITHYTVLAKDGPTPNNDDLFPIKISISDDVFELETPINSFENGIKGQGYNKLSVNNIVNLLEAGEESYLDYYNFLPSDKLHYFSDAIDLLSDEEWYEYCFLKNIDHITTETIWDLTPENRINLLSDEEWYEYCFLKNIDDNTTTETVWDLIPNNRVDYIKYRANLVKILYYTNNDDIVRYFGELYRELCGHSECGFIPIEDCMNSNNSDCSE